MIFAAGSGDPEALRVLISQGVDVNAKAAAHSTAEADGDVTPLMVASGKG
jgi:hypothetical protein